MSSDAATYVYCLVRSAARPDLSGAPAGLEGTSAPRLLESGSGHWLVVADAPLERYSAERIQQGLRDLDWIGQRAVEHEAVVEYALRGGTVVPMKLFTLFLGDERALDDVRARAREIQTLCDALEGKQEWGLRLLIDAAAAAQAVREQARDEAASAVSAGQAFMLRKQRERKASQGLREELAGRADALFDELSDLSADARRRALMRGEGTLLLDASFLVSVDLEPDFQTALQAGRAPLEAVGVQVRLSGPWPAYNFIEPAQ